MSTRAPSLALQPASAVCLLACFQRVPLSRRIRDQSEHLPLRSLQRDQRILDECPRRPTVHNAWCDRAGEESESAV
eukprot:2032840-Pyramimonas_sp.AAC.1